MELLKTKYLQDREKKSESLTYHHCRCLEHTHFGVVVQKRVEASDKEDFYKGAYEWLEKQVGFYPLFLAVGRTLSDLRMTGYQHQWIKLLERGPDGKKYRGKGDVENLVLFSFREFPGGVFVGYHNWHMVLNSQYNNYQLTCRERQMILRPSWIKNDWIACANKNPHSVQLVVPELDLKKAESVFVCNKETKRKLEEMGFANVSVARLTVGDTSLA